MFTCVSSLSCAADFDGDSTTAETSRAYVSGQTGIDAAGTAVGAASGLKALYYEPGLYFAAKTQADALAASNSISGGTTLATRVAAHGTAGTLSTEVIQGSSDSAKMVVVNMLIDDLDSANKGRAALLSSAATQAGVAVAASTASSNNIGKVTSAIIDSDFKPGTVTCTAAVATVVEV